MYVIRVYLLNDFVWVFYLGFVVLSNKPVTCMMLLFVVMYLLLTLYYVNLCNLQLCDWDVLGTLKFSKMRFMYSHFGNL